MDPFRVNGASISRMNVRVYNHIFLGSNCQRIYVLASFWKDYNNDWSE